MRVLKFVVDDQIIDKHPNCSFENLVPGTEGYLQAEFSFSPEWKDCVKFATFSTKMGAKSDPVVLRDGKSCIIPSEVLKKRTFKVKITGVKGAYKITTDEVAVRQNGGKI